MRTRVEIQKMIDVFESQCQPLDEFCELDEGDQAKLQALYWVLGDQSI